MLAPACAAANAAGGGAGAGTSEKDVTKSSDGMSVDAPIQANAAGEGRRARKLRAACNKALEKTLQGCT